MTKLLLSILVFAYMVGLSRSIDLALDRVECDNALPIFAYEGDISMTCNGEERCTFGNKALIAGTLYYDNANAAGMANYTKGYATAHLRLVTLEYELFHDLPVDFCGDWVYKSEYNHNDCPGNGAYHFSIPYTLPPQHDGTTWFATGWRGTSRIDIRTGPNNRTAMVGSCVLHLQTYTTQSTNSNWRTLPSAAAVSISMAGILVVLLFLICVLGCCSSSHREVTDETPMKTPMISPVGGESTGDWDGDGVTKSKFEFHQMEEGGQDFKKEKKSKKNKFGMARGMRWNGP